MFRNLILIIIAILVASCAKFVFDSKTRDDETKQLLILPDIITSDAPDEEEDKKTSPVFLPNYPITESSQRSTLKQLNIAYVFSASYALNSVFTLHWVAKLISGNLFNFGLAYEEPAYEGVKEITNKLNNNDVSAVAVSLSCLYGGNYKRLKLIYDEIAPNQQQLSDADNIDVKNTIYFEKLIAEDQRRNDSKLDEVIEEFKVVFSASEPMGYLFIFDDIDLDQVKVKPLNGLHQIIADRLNIAIEKEGNDYINCNKGEAVRKIAQSLERGDPSFNAVIASWREVGVYGLGSFVKKVIPIGIFSDPMMMLVSLDWYNSLSSEERQAIDEGTSGGLENIIISYLSEANYNEYLRALSYSDIVQE